MWRRERVSYAGRYYQLPLPGGTGLGKPLKLINHPVRERIPISIASLGPRNVALTAEIADGWQPVFYYPEQAAQVWVTTLLAGPLAAEPGEALRYMEELRALAP